MNLPEDINQRSHIFNLQSQTDVLTGKVSTALSIVGALTPFLAGRDEYGREVSASEVARHAAEDTFKNACAQLDLMLLNRANWETTSVADALKEQIREINAVNLQWAKHRETITRHDARPSVRAGAKYRRLPNGSIQVWVGDQEPPFSTLSASGKTMDEALTELDKLLS